MTYTNEQIENFIEGIYSGKYNESSNLPVDLYKAIAAHLFGGFDKGITAINWGGKNAAIMQSLRENIYMFSGAKTYQQVREMGTFVAEANSFAEFKAKAMEVYDTYNKNWLKAEYNTANHQAVAANQWAKIETQKELFPYLQYSAVMDDNTSEECAAFDGTTLKVEDPFWSLYTPPNHFNCRCVLEQVEEEDATPTEGEQRTEMLEVGREGVSDVFKMNPYKDEYVFSPEHPYFEVAPKDKDFAEDNFGLPIPKK